MMLAMGRRGCLLLWALGSLLLTACPGPRFVVNGFAVDEGQWKADRTKVLLRASPELDCPEESLGVTLLAAKETYLGGDATVNVATQVGVTGCGRRAVYTKSQAGWIANDPASGSKP